MGSLLQADDKQWSSRAAYVAQVVENAVRREICYSDVDSRWALVVSISYLVPDELPPVDCCEPVEAACAYHRATS